MVDALPTLEAYQLFRSRADLFEPIVLKIFRLLRNKEAQLRLCTQPAAGQRSTIAAARSAACVEGKI